MKPILLLFLLFTSTKAMGTTPDLQDFERVLFPVWTNLPLAGANSSQWIATATLNNPSLQPVPVYPVVSDYGRNIGTIEPRVSWSMTFISDDQFGMGNGADANIAGRLAYVARDRASLLAYVDRLYEPGANSTASMIEIPVVRERDLRTTTIALPEVPLDPRFRLMLRVYDPFQTVGAVVEVRFWADWVVSNAGGGPYSSNPSQLLGTRTLALQVAQTGATEVNVEPGYAELPFSSALLSDVPAYSKNIVVEVQPVTPGLRFWAFVTATDSATERVLTITPH